MDGCCGPVDDQMERRLRALLDELPPGHVLTKLIGEHEVILEVLGRLERFTQAVQAQSAFGPGRPEPTLLAGLAQTLLEAEPHHQREEQVLFPALEQCGVHGPTYAMRAEHEDLRSHKHHLADLAAESPTLEFPAFQRRLGQSARFLVECLRGHIARENYILYPLAHDVLREPGLWDRLQEQAERIGDCSFTPAAA